MLKESRRIRRQVGGGARTVFRAWTIRVGPKKRQRDNRFTLPGIANHLVLFSRERGRGGSWRFIEF